MNIFINDIVILAFHNISLNIYILYFSELCVLMILSSYDIYLQKLVANALVRIWCRIWSSIMLRYDRCTAIKWELNLRVKWAFGNFLERSCVEYAVGYHIPAWVAKPNMPLLWLFNELDSLDVSLHDKD